MAQSSQRFEPPQNPGRFIEVCSRATRYLVKGVDFKYRFPKENFEDVGDYDVLAYWPESNTWLLLECKYNLPAFCLKDARRLRDKIFGNGPDRGQFAKIEGRRQFFVLHAERMCELLKWPAPADGADRKMLEVYVSRDIHWWLRFPPYDVPTHFVRIDALDIWLRAQGVLQEANDQMVEQRPSSVVGG